jgi:hypothetical protein
VRLQPIDPLRIDFSYFNQELRLSSEPGEQPAYGNYNVHLPMDI